LVGTAGVGTFAVAAESARAIVVIAAVLARAATITDAGQIPAVDVGLTLILRLVRTRGLRAFVALAESALAIDVLFAGLAGDTVGTTAATVLVRFVAVLGLVGAMAPDARASIAASQLVTAIRILVALVALDALRAKQAAAILVGLVSVDFTVLTRVLRP
jgi:predicted small integral membrane protein